MANLATRIDFKVYIAGVLVPASQVTVGTEVPGISTAQINLPAHPLIFGLGEGDRLQVAIFYLDSTDPSGELHWNLLFEGHLTSSSYSASSGNREIIFSAISNIGVMDTLFLEFLGGKGNGKIGKPDKNTPNEITLKGNYPRRLFTEGLNNKTYIKRPFDLIGNIFLATTGRFLDRDVSKKSSKSMDVYIAKQRDILTSNRRLKLAQFSGDEERTKTFLLAELNSLKSKFETPEDKLAVEVGIEGVLDGTSFITRDRTTEDSLIQLLARFDETYLKTTAKNTVGKRDISTRSSVNTGFFARYFNLTKLEQHFVPSPILEGIPGGDTSKLPSGMFPILKTRRGKKYVRALTRQTGRKYGQNGSASALVNNLFTIMNYEVLDVIAPGICQVDDNGVPKAQFDKTKKNSIAQHITKPATAYGIPPSCNVLFPCMITSWNISNNYSAPPTRVYYERRSQGRKLDIKSTKKGYADHGTNVGYPAKITRHAQDASNSKRSDMEVLVFPEEYYRGPNPQFNEINPFLYEIKKQENSRRIDGVTKIPKDSIQQLSDDSIPGDQANLLEEAVLKASAKGNDSYGLFVKQAQVDYVNGKTMATSLSVNTVFNPNLIAGFSSLLMDSEDTNIHCMGYVRQVSHTLSAQGMAATSVSMTNVRTLKDMFIGILNQGAKYIVHPTEPLTEVREVFQVPEVANLYYKYLLYLGREEPSSLEDLELALTEANTAIKEQEQSLDSVENSDITPEKLEEEVAELTSVLNELILTRDNLRADIANRVQFSNPQASTDLGRDSFIMNWPKFFNLTTLSDNSEEQVSSLEDYIGSSRLEKTKEQLRDDYKKAIRGYITPKKELSPFFNNLAVATRYTRRPICTLEQYIDFYKTAPDFINPGSAVMGGRGRGTRAKKQYLDNESGKAPYYSLIREFVGGPGIEPGAKIAEGVLRSSETATTSQVDYQLLYRTAGTQETTITEQVFTELKKGQRATVQDLPDLSKDFQELLLLYSDIIKTKGEL